MTSAEIRKRFLKFFENREHAVLPSASLVPMNDPSVLFNTAGMQPLVPYLMGQKHPNGDKIANVQKCVRTTDIDDIGDKTHATFFEMLGNWSLGSYFKEDAIRWSFEFLTSKTEGLGLDPDRLYVTVFEGDENVHRDEESARIWMSLGLPKSRIFYKGADANWWPSVKGKDTWTGPTGPSTEMFYDIAGGLGELADIEAFNKADSDQKIVEIWNDVFMEYEKRDGVIVGKLSQKNVDTGAGLERLSIIMQNVDNIFETDLFTPIVEAVKSVSKNSDLRAERVVADHIRTSVFMVADGVLPSNTDRGYILRRLIRRAVRFSDLLGMEVGGLSQVIKSVPTVYGDAYPEITNKISEIESVINQEEVKFRKTLSAGIKEFEKISASGQVTPKDAFLLFSSFGFPVDLTIELAKEKGIDVDPEGVNEEFRLHQDKSRAGSEQKFKGGLADQSDMSIRYHTATHLLNASLKKILGKEVEQKGSNITPERLRFDFSYPSKLTPDQIKSIQDEVNSAIDKNLDVTFEEMSIDAAKAAGAVGVFGERYADIVRVYTIGKKAGQIFSMEICGGPHVEETGKLGKFKIEKEEAVSAGVRRIKATLS